MSEKTWVHSIVRPMVRPLAKTPVTPNQLTMLRIATAAAACLLLATGERRWAILGAIIFVVSFLLDRADGELARLSGKFTPLGRWLDHLSDSLANILLFLGLGIGVRHGSLGLAAIALGLIAGFAVAAVFVLAERIEETAGPDAAAFPTAAGFDPDDAMIIVPIAILLGGEVPILIAAAIGAPLFLLWTYWRGRKYLAAP